MIVLWRGNGVHVLRADIGPINLIYWAFNGIPQHSPKATSCNDAISVGYYRNRALYIFICSPLLVIDQSKEIDVFHLT